MKKNGSKTNICLLILGLMTLLTLVIVLFAPIATPNGYNGSVNGLSSIFGMDFTVYRISGSALTFKVHPVNGWGLAMLIMIALSMISSGFLAKYGRGWWIFAAILSLLSLIVLSIYSNSWVYDNISGGTRVHFEGGWGLVLGVIVLAIHCIGCLVAFKLNKKTR